MLLMKISHSKIVVVATTNNVNNLGVFQAAGTLLTGIQHCRNISDTNPSIGNLKKDVQILKW
jgi:hypothetical protein